MKYLFENNVYDSAVHVIPVGAIPLDNLPDKPNQYSVFENGNWIPDDSQKPSLIQICTNKINLSTVSQLAAGITFEGNIFPLYGDLYGQNMANASAYNICGDTGDIELFTVSGGYCTVTDLKGLISAGKAAATIISKNGVDQITALTTKTTAELITMATA